VKSVQSISIKEFVFLDECGVSIQMTRSYGRSPRGKRVKGSVPANWGRTTTILGAITIEGILAAMHIESPTDKAVFLAFLKEVLVPELRPGQVIVMDNLSPHKVTEVRKIIEQAKCYVLYLPPYSPDFNPIEILEDFNRIEQAWSKIKWYLRGVKAREQKTLAAAISDALNTVSSSNAQGWFRNCGYMVYA
jgi:transposase